MKLPQEKYFKKTQEKSSFIVITFRRLMWCFVLFSAFFTIAYLSLCMIWLILGAIIDPAAFLPYATGAATFITVVSSKSKDFKDISDNGFQAVMQEVEKAAGSQINNLMSKMNLQGKMKSLMNSDAVKGLGSAAVKMGLMDPNTLKKVEDNAVALASDPTKAAQTLGKDIQEIANDPQAFAEKMKDMMEKKAFGMIQIELKKVLNEKPNNSDVSTALLSCVEGVVKDDKKLLKESIKNFLRYKFWQTDSTKSPELYEILSILSHDDISEFLLSFAFQDGSQSSKKEDFLQSCIKAFGEIASTLLSSFTKDEKTQNKIYLGISPTLLSNVLNLFHAIQQVNSRQILDQSLELIKDLNIPAIQPYLTPAEKLFDLSLNLLGDGELDKINFHSLLDSVKTLINAFGQLFSQPQQLQQQQQDQSQALPVLDPIFDTVKNFISPFLEIISTCLDAFEQQQKPISISLLKTSINNLMQYFASKKNLDISQDIEKRINGLVSLGGMIFGVLQHDLTALNVNDIETLVNAYNTMQDKNKQLKFDDKESKLMQKALSMMKFIMSFAHNPSQMNDDIERIAVSTFKMDKTLVKELKLIFTNRLKSVTDSDSTALLGGKVLTSIEKKYNVPQNILLGIINILLGKSDSAFFDHLIDYCFEWNKIDKNKKPLIASISTIYHSIDEIALQKALEVLYIDPKLLFLLLINKKILKESQLTQDQKDVVDKLKAYDDSLKQGKKKKAAQKNSQQSKQENQIEETKPPEMPESYNIQNTFLKLDTPENVQSFMKVIANDQNSLLTLSNNQIDFLKKIVQVGPKCSTKQIIDQLTVLINTPKELLDGLTDLFTNTDPEKVIKTMESMGLEEISQSDSMPKFLNFVLSKVDSLKQLEKFVDEEMGKLFAKKPDEKSKKKVNEKGQFDILKFFIFQHSKSIIPVDLIRSMLEMVLGDQFSTIYEQIQPAIHFLTGNHEMALKHYIKSKEDNTSMSKSFQMITSSLRYQGQSTKQLSSLFQYFSTTSNSHLLLASFYAFFNGKVKYISIESENGKRINNKDTDITVTDILCENTGFPLEFFSCLHALFLQNSLEFVKSTLKFFRVLEKQRILDDPKSPPELKNLPVQSLIAIPDKIAQNLIHLVHNISFTNSVFAKTLGMPLAIIEFLQTLRKIKLTKNSPARSILYDSLRSNVSCKEILGKLNINIDDLETLLRLVFLDFDWNVGVDWMVKSLNLKDKVKNLGIFKSLSALADVRSSKIDSLMIFDKSNMGKDYESSDAELKSFVDMSDLAKNLIQGRFRSFTKKKVALLQSPEEFSNSYPEATEIYEALLGILATKPRNQMTSSTTRQILYDIKMQLSDTKSTKKFVQVKNDKEYAVYLMVKQFGINPMWMLLMTQDISAWKYLESVYQSQKSVSLDPIIVFLVMFIFTSMPLTYKKLLSDFEWIINMKNMTNDNFIKDLTLQKGDLPISDLFLSDLKAKDTNIVSPQKKEEEEKEVEEEKKDNNSNAQNNNENQSQSHDQQQQQDQNQQQQQDQQQQDQQEQQEQENEMPSNMMEFKSVDDLEKFQNQILVEIFENFTINMYTNFDDLIDNFNIKEKLKSIFDISAAKIEEHLEQFRIGYIKDFIRDKYKSTDKEKYKLLLQYIQDQTYYLDPELDELASTKYKSEIFKKVFNDVASLFLDPREYETIDAEPLFKPLESEQADGQQSKQQQSSSGDIKDQIKAGQYIQNQYFYTEATMFAQLSLGSDIDIIRRGYKNICGMSYEDLEDTQARDRLITQRVYLDNILTIIEQNNFYKPTFDYFSKYRFMPYFGLSAGILLNPDDLISYWSNTRSRRQIIAYDTVAGYSYAINDNTDKIEDHINGLQAFRMNFYQKMRTLNCSNLAGLCKSDLILPLKYKELFEIVQNSYDDDYSNYMKSFIDVYKLDDWYSWYFIQDNYRMDSGLLKDKVIANYRLNFLKVDQIEGEIQVQQSQTKDELANILYQLRDDSEDYDVEVQQQQQNERLFNRNKGINQDKMICLRTFGSIQVINKEFNNIQKAFDSNNFKDLVSFYKKDYDIIKKNYHYFMDSYSQDSSLLYGLVSLVGLMEDQNSCDYESLFSYITSLCQGSTSNLRILADLVGLFVNCKKDYAGISSQIQIDQDIFTNFVEIVLDTADDKLTNLNAILPKFKLSPTDVNYLIQMIQLYGEDFSVYRSIFKSAKKIKYPGQFGKAWENILNSIPPYKFHSQPFIEWKKFSLLKYFSTLDLPKELFNLVSQINPKNIIIPAPQQAEQAQLQQQQLPDNIDQQQQQKGPQTVDQQYKNMTIDQKNKLGTQILINLIDGNFTFLLQEDTLQSKCCKDLEILKQEDEMQQFKDLTTLIGINKSSEQQQEQVQTSPPPKMQQQQSKQQQQFAKLSSFKKLESQGINEKKQRDIDNLVNNPYILGKTSSDHGFASLFYGVQNLDINSIADGLRELCTAYNVKPNFVMLITNLLESYSILKTIPHLPTLISSAAKDPNIKNEFIQVWTSVKSVMKFFNTIITQDECDAFYSLTRLPDSFLDKVQKKSKKPPSFHFFQWISICESDIIKEIEQQLPEELKSYVQTGPGILKDYQSLLNGQFFKAVLDGIEKEVKFMGPAYQIFKNLYAIYNEFNTASNQDKVDKYRNDVATNMQFLLPEIKSEISDTISYLISSVVLALTGKQQIQDLLKKWGGKVVINIIRSLNTDIKDLAQFVVELVLKVDIDSLGSKEKKQPKTLDDQLNKLGKFTETFIHKNIPGIDKFLKIEAVKGVYTAVKSFLQLDQISLVDPRFQKSIILLLGTITGAKTKGFILSDKQSFCLYPKFPLQETISIFDLCQGKVEGVFSILSIVGVSKDKVKPLRAAFEEVEKLGLFSSAQTQDVATGGGGGSGDSNEDELNVQNYSLYIYRLYLLLYIYLYLYIQILYCKYSLMLNLLIVYFTLLLNYIVQ